MYLLDTDVLSNLMKRVPAGALVARLAMVAPEDQFTSSVTLGELLYGAHRSARAVVLLERIGAVLPDDLPVLPFDTAAARRYGKVRAEMEKKGHTHRRRGYANSGDRADARAEGGYRQRALFPVGSRTRS